jgi:hypothetical protein
MIKPNDLRVNNWVKYREHFDKIRENDFTASYFNSYEPITLSPEIFEKSGFKRESKNDRHGRVYKRDGCKYIIRRVNFGKFDKRDYGWAFELSDENNWVTIVPRIFHLHQLQNLIYILTGEELSIEL